MEAHAARLSHRTLPRFIDERRWWLCLLIGWSLAVGLYTRGHLTEINQQTIQVALEGARNMFRMVVLTRNWNAAHGGIYVPVTTRTQPNPYLKHPQRDLTTTDGMQLTMVNPAYMTRLIAEMAESDSGAIFRLTSLKPIRPDNAPDAWEENALLGFEKGGRETHGVVENTHGRQFRYMAPLKVTKTCMNCHAEQGYKVGDIRGGISISQAYAPIESAIQAQTREAIQAAALTFSLVSIFAWLMLEMLRRRWLELADKMRQLEETQSQLLQSEKLAAIGQLAAGVAHEINNPIGFVNSNLGTLKSYTAQMTALLDRCRTGAACENDFTAADYDYLKQDLTDLIGESQGGLDRVRKIVADLKDFSRIEHHDKVEADLNAGIESTLNVVWNELKYKAEVIREFGTLPPVRCIAAQINQVVMNLLINAAHAIDQHGTITVRTGHDEKTAWIEIEDTGSGMAPDVMAHIFEPFYTTKAVGKGTGLGLSLSYDIIRKHGGQIEVDSTPGQGSRFRITLPLAAPAN